MILHCGIYACSKTYGDTNSSQSFLIKRHKSTPPPHTHTSNINIKHLCWKAHILKQAIENRICRQMQDLIASFEYTVKLVIKLAYKEHVCVRTTHCWYLHLGRSLYTSFTVLEIRNRGQSINRVNRYGQQFPRYTEAPFLP